MDMGLVFQNSVKKSGNISLQLFYGSSHTEFLPWFVNLKRSQKMKLFKLAHELNKLNVDFHAVFTEELSKKLQLLS